MLHLFGRNHFAAALDEVARPSRKVDVAVFVHIAQVPGEQPAAADGLGGRLILPPVALHQPRAARRDLAHIALPHRFPVFVEDIHIYIVQRNAYRGKPPNFLFNLFGASLQEVVFGRKHRDGRRRFGLPECVDEIDAREFVYRAAYDFDGHRRCAVGDDVQAAKVVIAEFGMVHQHFQHRGHHHSAAGAFRLHKAHPFLGVELALDYQCAPPENCRHNRLHARDVIQRHGQDVALLVVRIGGGHGAEDVGGEAVVCQHHAFGELRRPRCEQDDGQVVAVAVWEALYVVARRQQIGV